MGKWDPVLDRALVTARITAIDPKAVKFVAVRRNDPRNNGGWYFAAVHFKSEPGSFAFPTEPEPVAFYPEREFADLDAAMFAKFFGVELVDWTGDPATGEAA